jgi:uncharacterized repeat protein (TIGR03837 family)
MRLDIFCTVIDNYGDIGIAWRLARQLVAEYGVDVRLWVDDLASFWRIRPEIAADADPQWHLGVEIRRWRDTLPPGTEPAEVVIEALACELPETYVQAMAERTPKPVWINLEYLSAEDWIVGCHGLPSPHPRLPLVKYFFFPGWRPGTGGVLREEDLLPAIQDFRSDPGKREAFWRALGLDAPAGDETRFSLFAYENAAIPELLDAWSRHDHPITCLVPEGRPVAQVAGYFGVRDTHPGDRLSRGALTVRILPFLDQDTYDRLLWACDLNFVRGEDSFTRACWAGAPLVWQAYRQEENAHWPKIDAFLALYTQGLAPDAVEALTTLWRAWNAETGVAQAWPAFWAARDRLRAHHKDWMERVAHLGDLADNLMHFCQEKL